MWKKIKRFFQNLFGGKNKEQVKETVRKIMNVVRDVVNHPGADVIVSLTATNLDNKALEIARRIVNGFYIDLATRQNNNYSHKARFGSVNVNDVPYALIDGLRKLPSPEREKELENLEQELERGFSEAL